MTVDTSVRSDAPEIMDNFDMEGEVLRDALDKIASINQLLGGNKVTLEGIKILINKHPKGSVISIADVGCGNGDMLRSLANYGAKNDLNFLLTGIDANSFTINHACNLSLKYDNISYQCLDVFKELNNSQPYEIILCTLTLHHFKDNEIVALLNSFKNQASLGFVINDLHRSAIAYHLFKAICFVFKLNDMSREDGLTSILRGFKKADLLNFSKKLNIKYYTIKWKWAFRYQWIVKTS